MNKIKLYWQIVSPILSIGSMAIVVFFIVGMFLSIPLCLLWNWLMPHIFGLPAINVLEAFGLSAIITLLAPKEIKWNKPKEDIPQIDDDIEDKLEKVLIDITTQFKA